MSRRKDPLAMFTASFSVLTTLTIMAQNWERNQVRTDRNLAVNLAHSHLKSLSPAERLVTRYVWRKKVPALTLKFPNGIPDLRSLRTIFLTMNFNSQGDFIY